MAYPNKRANDAIYSSVTNGFTQRDWIDLALAALDQAGIDVALQERIEALLPEEGGEQVMNDTPERDAFAHEGPDLSTLDDDERRLLARAMRLETCDMSLADDGHLTAKRCKKLEAIGLLAFVGRGILCDGDGYALQPEREVPCYEITDAGRDLVRGGQ